MSTKLGWEQALKNSYDEASSSLKTTLQNLEIAMELSADDGDSVITLPKTVNSYSTFSTAQTSGTIAMAPVNISFCNTVSFVFKNQDGNTQFAIEISPSDTADVWHQVSTHTSPNGTSHHVPTYFPCRRIRLKFSNNFAGTGPIEIWLNGRA
jgi:hypothetical protein